MDMPFAFTAGILAGIILGVVTAYLILRGQSKRAFDAGIAEAGREISALGERIRGFEERIIELQNERASLKEEWRTEAGEKNLKIDRLTEKVSFLQEKLSVAEITLQKERSQFGEKIELLKSARDELSRQFKELSGQIFDDRSRVFSSQTSTAIGQLLQPFREQIEGFRQQIENTRVQDLQERTSLKNEIENLARLNQQINEEAGNLTKALKGEIKTQGTWGEMILEKVLEKSGLVKGREFEIQENLKTPDGTRLQPDVVVHLPDSRDVVIDSKVSLASYEKIVSAESEEERQKASKELVQSIRAHIKGLGDKDYHKLLGINSLDFVFMFVPMEGAFSAAVQADSTIFSAAFEKNIILVSPSTLLASLRTIDNIWKYESQSRNAREIARRAGLLYDKFAGFVNDLEEVGKGIDNARKSYDRAFNKLSRGRGNLVRMSENLKSLGASASKSLPSSILPDDGDTEEEADEESSSNNTPAGGKDPAGTSDGSSFSLVSE